MMRGLATTIGLAAMLATGVQAQTENAPTGDAAKGRDTFMRAGCFACHGTLGKGAERAPRLATEPWPIDAFIMKVRDPSNFAMPSGMPFYTEKSLTDGDLADIHAFLTSVPGDPAPKDIPLLHLTK